MKSYSAVFGGLKNTGIKPFYVISKPYIISSRRVNFQGSSCDLNVYENISSILKDCDECRTVSYDGIPSLNDLRKEATEALKKMKFDAIWDFRSVTHQECNL